MTVTTLERIELPTEDVEIPCDRSQCSSDLPARWVVRYRHGCTLLYCEACREALLTYAARPGDKWILCIVHDSWEGFSCLSEIVTSMDRL